MRSFFSHDALLGAGLVGGPMVWGVSPEQPGTGLGALSYAMRHVGGVGRPVGGSGALTEALRAALRPPRRRAAHRAPPSTPCSATGRVRRASPCADGTEITAPVVVSACDPQRTFVRWLRRSPAGAASMIDRWRRAEHAEGYESKVDAIVDREPRLRDSDARPVVVVRRRPDDRRDGPGSIAAASGRHPRAAGADDQRAVDRRPVGRPAGPARVQPRGAADPVPPRSGPGRASRGGGSSSSPSGASRGSSTRSSPGAP